MEEYYSTNQVAKMLGMLPITVRRWITRKELPAVKLSKSYRISRSDLTKFLEERKLIFKKYSGNLIDPKTVYALRSKIPFSNLIRRRFPTFYNLIKKIIWSVIDQFHYQNKDTRHQ